MQVWIGAGPSLRTQMRNLQREYARVRMEAHGHPKTLQTLGKTLKASALNPKTLHPKIPTLSPKP